MAKKMGLAALVLLATGCGGAPASMPSTNVCPPNAPAVAAPVAPAPAPSTPASATAAAPSAPDPSQEITVVSGLSGPEGPLVVDGNLYFVDFMAGTLSKWDGKTTTVLNTHAGCGHNGLALTKQKTFLLACAEQKGAIYELDMAGKELRHWDADAKGAPFAGGVNDIVVASDGGAYATIFGPLAMKPTVVVGEILHLAPGAKNWTVVARDLNYANGIAISPDRKTLYVSETVGNCILAFTIEKDGSLSHRSNFALLSRLTPNKYGYWWLGPDSMKVDHAGNVYVAQFFGGKVLAISPDGKLLHEFDIAAGDGTTNVAFDEGEKNLYVTVVKDPTEDKWTGSVVKIPNVGH
ncbi:MAG TPA: SMP-30/gluconolactonase/LRE family protein [Polyangiaceae bacterium]